MTKLWIGSRVVKARFCSVRHRSCEDLPVWWKASVFLTRFQRIYSRVLRCVKAPGKQHVAINARLTAHLHNAPPPPAPHDARRVESLCAFGYNFDIQIHLMELPNPDPVSGRPEHGGRDRHVAFTIRDLTPLKNRLDHAGVTYTMSKSGRAALFCRDLDGNAFEVRYDPRTFLR